MIFKMNVELVSFCIERLHRFITETGHNEITNVTEIKYEVQSHMYIFHSFDFGQINNVLVCLSEAVDALERANIDLNYTNPTHFGLSMTGMKGSPKLQIPLEITEYLAEYKFTITQMAALLGVSKSTVCRRLGALYISLLTRFSSMSNDELDNKVSNSKYSIPKR